ncbi:hypothetical protein P6121_004795 [Citrobacter freundii]
MSNIDKQARQVSRYDLVSGYMQKWPDGEFVYHSDYQALLDELEVKDSTIAEHRKVLNSLAAVARRYLPDYDEHPEIQAADELLNTAAGIGVKGE